MKRVVKAFAGAVLSLLAACSGSRTQGAAEDTQSPAPLPDAGVPPQATAPAERGWKVGARHQYDLKLTTVIRLGDGPTQFDFDLVGKLFLIPTEVTADEDTVYARIGELQVVNRLTKPQAELDRVAQQITAAGCFFKLSGGRLTEMRVVRGTSPPVLSTYREVASALQFVHGDPAVEPGDYTVQEYDTIGQYVTEYVRGVDSRHWRKQKRRYIALLSSGNPSSPMSVRVMPEVVASSAEVRLSADGHPKDVLVQDELAIQGAQAPVRSRAAVSLEEGPSALVGDALQQLAVLLQDTDRVGAGEVYGPPPPLEAVDAARINGLTFEKVVARLEQLARSKGTGHAEGAPGGASAADDASKQGRASLEENARLFGALAAIFREHPDTVERAVRMIRAKSPASVALVESLGSASTATADAALVDLMNAKVLDANIRQHAATALIRTQRPEGKAIAALKAMLADEPFSTTALFGLGSYSRRLRDEGKADEATAVADIIVERLPLAKQKWEKLAVLGGVANSGYLPALPRLAPYLADGEDDVRSAAVRSLRNMPGEQVDALLGNRITTDLAAKVRISAIEAAQMRQPTDLLATPLFSASTDPEPHVRFAAVELMAHWLDRRPELRAALEHVASADEEPRIRERARGAVSRP
jgi:hypothetical protein